MGDKGSFRLRGVALACVGLGILIWFSSAQKRGWKEIRRGARPEWVKGNVTHTDENGDGVVDEELVADPKSGKRSVRRDTDLDGYFDLQYNLSPSGFARNITKIHRKAPRHQEPSAMPE